MSIPTPASSPDQPEVGMDRNREHIARARREGRASTLLGAGLSGVVFRTTLPSGRVVARKVFDSDGLAAVVQVALLGSVNPYIWNEDAVRCAVLRRQLLVPLTRYWFGDRLRLATVQGWSWNAEWRAYQIEFDFIEGRPPALHHPFRHSPRDEVSELRDGIMRPLQKHLAESGFTGLTWQAGRGNPLALSNFLLVGPREKPETVWIDLESGVPALFSPSPWAQLRWYLPQAARQRRPLFDDVDVERLTAYVAAHTTQLERLIGSADLRRMQAQVDELRQAQARWKGLSRLRRAIYSQRMAGLLSAEQAGHYLASPVRFWLRESIRLPLGAADAFSRFLRRGWARMRRLPLRKLPRSLYEFFRSQAYRVQVASKFVGTRIDSWERREQMTSEQADALREQLGHGESSTYLSDFGVHLAIKPFVKAIEYFLVPALYAYGSLTEADVGLALLLGGPLVRTLYTSARCVQTWCTGREVPLVALGTGVLPVVGNFAFPLQLVVSSRDNSDRLAQFILYDGCATVGRKLPIWGGPDTSTEHALNRLPDLVIERQRRKQRGSDARD